MNKNHNHRRPTFVIIGHSVGGIVAQALLTKPDFDVSQIDVLITLSAPHKQPVVSMDTDLVAFYDKIHRRWPSVRNSSAANGLSTVSISGGVNDLLVRSELTKLSTQFDHNIVSTAVQGVWLTMDHLCIVWCRQ